MHQFRIKMNLRINQFLINKVRLNNQIVNLIISNRLKTTCNLMQIKILNFGTVTKIIKTNYVNKLNILYVPDQMKSYEYLKVNIFMSKQLKFVLKFV